MVEVLLSFDDVAVTADNVGWICAEDDMLGDDGDGEVIVAL